MAEAKRRKRGHGEGTISQRPDGRWIAQVMVGYKPDGKVDRRTVYGRTRAECQAKLDNLRTRASGGLLGDADKERDTVAAYLDRWVETTKTSVRPKTYERYAEIVRLHLTPGLGRHKLIALKPDHVQRFYADALNTPRSRGGKRPPRPLAPRTVHHCHRVLHRALRMAVRWGYVATNVCDRLDSPRVPHREMTPSTPEQVECLLADAEARGDRLAALWATAAYTGCRQGELLALKWHDLDLDRGTLTVRRSLEKATRGVPTYDDAKSATSHRTLSLPADAVVALREHRDRQEFERQRLGDAWGDYGLVFPTTLGTAYTASECWRRFKAALERAGLPASLRFHDLRHGNATAMFRAGVHPKAASVRLGHSTVQITLDLYTHAQQEMDIDAADKLGAVFRRARAAISG